ncbi:MAG: flagellar assembly protein FliW [bacterium]
MKTRLFGEMDIAEQEVLTFPSGLIGLKDLKRFILLKREQESPFKWLQSLDDPNLCFFVITPRSIRPDYRVSVHKDVLRRMGIGEGTEIMVLCLVTISRDPQAVTVNFQAPLVINKETRTGRQIILVNGGGNRSRHDLAQELDEQGGTHDRNDQNNQNSIFDIRSSG